MLQFTQQSIRSCAKFVRDGIRRLIPSGRTIDMSLAGTLRELAASSYRDLALRRLSHRTRSPLQDKPVEIRNARVLSPDWHVILPGDGIRLNDEVSHKKWLVQRTSQTQAVIRYPHKLHTVTQPCILLGGHYNYYHHLIDYIFNFYFMDLAWKREKKPFLILQPEARFQKQILQFLGLTDSDVITVPNLCAVKCSSLTTIPRSFRKFGTALDPKVFDWIRDRFSGRFARGSRRIFISRRDAGRRRILNEAEVMESLADLNFETVVLERLSFAEQVELFAQANVVVGAHGAGLTNVVFSGAQSIVVELMPSDIELTRKFYENLAIGGQQRYFRLLGGPRDSSMDFAVAPGELRKVLREAGVS